ncbi:5'-nucleotidase C-terminal domain-containing protein [Sporosarcina trichiuri]|uniref:5'-nucleotidase C-terminal domain-containing protein n=1 Tax=Sporosarcina trichiuri TaxID=3056445 RepID=UPI0025B2F95D|nr:5'-nucleotidase C-terminal domain-containing protein [Sporosarcina sp. 0.2-SM1T-5]WJY26467.1 5'-nucleotidase C-terminal domain-containing protein [Sporosarcina sp. 0.2-SM1T-5]
MNKNTKFLATAVTAAAVASAIAVPSASADTSKFTDVSDRYADAVNFLWANNITQGVSADKFGTASDVKRADAAVFLAKLMGLEPGGVYEPSGFTDVPKSAKWAVDALKEHGIVSGKSATKFGANEQLTRGEAAAIIVRAAKLQVDMDKTSTKFTDVNKRFAPYVQALVDEKIANGKTDKMFGTSMPVTRGELAMLLNNGNAKFGYLDLLVMHMNDHHAYLDNFPYIANVVQDLRATHKNSLLLHGGDVFSGDLYWNKYKGQADVVMMNYLGFDAVTFGNHEFDEGGTPDGHAALRNYILGAQFPVLGANLDFKDDAKLKSLYKGGIAENAGGGEIYDGNIVMMDGQKVGMFGLTTEDTVNISSPADVDVLSYITRAKETVAALEAQGVDKIIAITHVGVDEAAPSGSDQTLAKMVPGIDVIVGGHTHTALKEPITITHESGDKTLIVQAGQYGDYVGKLDVKFNPKGEIYWNHGELIKIDPKTMTADPQAAAVLAPFKAGKEELKKESIGVTTDVDLNGARDSNAEGTSSVRHNETNLGNLIADAMLSKAKTLPGMEEATVVAMQNGGGIRTSIEAGDITVGSIAQVLPFGNPLAIVKSNGKEVKEALERSVRGALIAEGKGLKEDGGFLHVGGMKFTYDSTKESGKRVIDVLVKEGDKYVPLEDDKTVYIATNSFTARGGDDYDVFERASAEGRVSDPGFSDTQNLIEYLQSLGKEISPKIEGRIIDVSLETQQNGYKVPAEEPAGK